MKIQKILCPVDFSALSTATVGYAESLAEQYDARVEVLHVMPDDWALEYSYLAQRVPNEEEEKQARRELGEFVEHTLSDHRDVSVALKTGDPRAVIMEHAEKMKADLIVMGTHGRRGMKRLMLGSVTEAILRESTRPVMAIPPSAETPKAKEPVIQRLLCPVDLSKGSLAGLDLATALESEATELTVIDILHFIVWPTEAAVSAVLHDVQEKMYEDAVEELKEALKSRNLDCKYDVKFSADPAYREILKLAEELNSSAIVMGVEGRSASDRFFFGSTTNQVVRQAKCPVLVTRRGGSESD